MNSKINDVFESIRAVLDERRGGVEDLKFPSDCDQRSLLRAAERDATVKHGGNHDSVIDPDTGQVITQLPRHNPTTGTCRAIIKDLKKAIMARKKAQP